MDQDVPTTISEPSSDGVEKNTAFAMPSRETAAGTWGLENVATSLRTKGHEPLVIGRLMEEIRPTSWYTSIYMVVYIPGGAGLKLRPITDWPLRDCEYFIIGASRLGREISSSKMIKIGHPN